MVILPTEHDHDPGKASNVEGQHGELLLEYCFGSKPHHNAWRFGHDHPDYRQGASPLPEQRGRHLRRARIVAAEGGAIVIQTESGQLLEVVG